MASDSIFTYFIDKEIKRFFSDIKRITPNKPRKDYAKRVLLYSLQFHQLIYIKQSVRRQPLNKHYMHQYQKRNITDMKRLMIKQFGPKEGIRLFTKADKLDILTVEKASKQIYRYLRELNRLDGSYTYNRKTFHMIFDRQKKSGKEAAGIIYGALYRRIERQYESTINKLKQKKRKDFNGKAFGDLKTQLNNMRDTFNNLASHHYMLMGEKRIYDSLPVPEDLDTILHDLSKGVVLKK